MLDSLHSHRAPVRGQVRDKVWRRSETSEDAFRITFRPMPLGFLKYAEEKLALTPSLSLGRGSTWVRLARDLHASQSKSIIGYSPSSGTSGRGKGEDKLGRKSCARARKKSNAPP